MRRPGNWTVGSNPTLSAIMSGTAAHCAFINGCYRYGMDPRLLRFYNSHMLRFGMHDPRGLGWRDAVSQQVRFQVLADVADLTGASILDEGCGFGDLYPYLTTRFPGITYTGVDINSAAIAVAKERYPEVSFEACDFSQYEGKRVDYVLSSGALTFRIEDYDLIYRSHIRKMFDLCTKGVAFNVLDLHGIAETDEYLGYDPNELSAFCRTLTPNVQLRHDYSPEDFTVYLYR